MTHTANNELTTGPGARFTPGELVDVTIRGARVLDEPTTTTVRVEWGIGPASGLRAIVYRADATRRAPAEWPPQPADVWQDRNGDRWATLGTGVDDIVEMCRTGDRRARWTDPAEVLDTVGPMRLEYRPGWSPAAPAFANDPVDGDPVEVDPRTGWVAGLRELADLLERNPSLPFNPHDILIGGRNYGAEGVRQWAYALGVDVQSSPASDGVHWYATGNVGGASIRCYWIDETGAGLDQPEPELVDERGDAEKTQQVEDDAANGPQLVDDDTDGRCTGFSLQYVVKEDTTRSHKCELYDTINPDTGDTVPHDGDHVCACNYRWANEPDQPVPAPREAAE